MTRIYGTAVTASGQPAIGRRVTIQPSRGAIASGQAVAAPSAAITDRTGYWELEVIPNSELTPAGTYYVLRQFGVKFFIEVPDSETPVPATALLVDRPDNPVPPNTYVYDIAGHSGSINAETLTAIVGTVEGAEAVITSVDGRTGVVTLNDKYATLIHNHDDRYSQHAHTHNYSPSNHLHDDRYVQLNGERVRSIDGLTGDIDLTSVYAEFSHSHEGGGDHTHEGYASETHDHAGTYSPVSHLHDDHYVQLGQETVTSVNGQTGDVVISGGGGGGAVDSVNGQTGDVDLDDEYSPLGHTHSYASDTHNHEGVYVEVGEESVVSVDGQTGAVDLSEFYEPLGHTHDFPVDSVDGRTGTVTLGDLYSATGHTHSYAATSHTHAYASDTHHHDSAYAAAGHSHSYPVTSVDGLTGAVSLSSTYAASSHSHVHNHDSAYSATGHTHAYASDTHNHNAAYSAVGHTHTYPVTSVDGLTGAVSLSSTYASTGHTHSALTNTVGAWVNCTPAGTVTGTCRVRYEYINGATLVRLDAKINGSVSSGGTIATIPAGYRPLVDSRFPINQNMNAAVLQVTTGGVCTASISMSTTAANYMMWNIVYLI